MRLNNLVSVVVPTYRRPGMLSRAINSILTQTYSNIEVIVVDDNDEESEYRKETESFMRKYEDDKRVKYIKHKENKGGSAARNTGIKEASGDLISFLDDDDEYFPEKIEKQVIKFNTNKLENLAFVYCQMDIYDKDDLLFERTKNYYNGNLIPFQNNMVKTIAGTPSILVSKSVLVEIGGFKDLKSGQDWYLIHEILLKGYSIDYLEESLVKVHIHDEERISNSKTKVESLNKLLEIKSRSFDKVNKKYKKLVLYQHNMLLANHVKFTSKFIAMGYFLKALKYNFFSKKNIFFLGSLLVNREVVSRIKRRLL